MKRLIWLIPLILLDGFIYDLDRWWNGAGPATETTVFTIGPGASLARVASQLDAKGLLERPDIWRWLIRLQEKDGAIKRGEYEVPPGASPAQLLLLLTEGRVKQYSVTLPEGITLRQALDILQSNPVLEPQLSGPGDERLQQLWAPRESGEGLFFPDTYVFTRGESDLDILIQAHTRLRRQLAQAWEERSEGLPYQDAYEALVMASVVEKETGTPEERPRIAGVFVRRLQKGMRLQTDPTVIYGLGEEFDGNLKRSHLRDSANPYNTYRHGGLPPTPIALPGRAAIDAALHPAAGSELYFVARGDGSHQFSDTLAQHQEAVRAWQLKRVENYRSSPAPSGRN